MMKQRAVCAAALVALIFIATACANEDQESGFVLTSDAFNPGAAIPSEYTCDGEDVSPALEWNGVPGGTKTFAITVRDPDSPSGDTRHWVAVNLPGDLKSLLRGTALPEGAVGVENDLGDTDYRGPCPPKGDGAHRYFFVLYALDTTLDGVESDTPFAKVIGLIEDAAIDSTELIGTYERLE